MAIIKEFNVEGQSTVKLLDCPKCAEKPYPAGKFIKSPIIRFNFEVKFWFVKVPVKVQFEIHYCPKCGFLAIREIEV